MISGYYVARVRSTVVEVTSRDLKLKLTIEVEVEVEVEV
jgi:hypothetical protein